MQDDFSDVKRARRRRSKGREGEGKGRRVEWRGMGGKEFIEGKINSAASWRRARSVSCTLLLEYIRSHFQ